ncbi:lipopolysaccharide assembly protein LapA domain-containing protein [Sporosarcina sp. 179-K 3D1 HS]|uniref:LapA family protein n=1 Tax=Sporosarcina sp. 179-K 3D1 HS TaxID=3232169 RepID=UPI0039A1E631
MKFQWTLLFGLLFAILIAVFAVFNVDSVEVNYVFGTAMWPLVLVILGSALLGALTSGFVAIFRSYRSNRRIKELLKELAAKETTIAAQQNEIAHLQKQSRTFESSTDDINQRAAE